MAAAPTGYEVSSIVFLRDVELYIFRDPHNFVLSVEELRPSRVFTRTLADGADPGLEATFVDETGRVCQNRQETTGHIKSLAFVSCLSAQDGIAVPSVQKGRISLLATTGGLLPNFDHAQKYTPSDFHMWTSSTSQVDW